MGPQSSRSNRPIGLALRYVGFAAVATAINLIAQELTVRLAPQLPLMISILAGTIAGFGAKYVFDKIWIFNDGYAGAGAEFRKIGLYGLFSVATTAIFWGMEMAFWTIWGSVTAKYAGAILGLATGYAIKYEIDRRFVFSGAAGRP